jgi:hypothetical protein
LYSNSRHAISFTFEAELSDGGDTRCTQPSPARSILAKKLQEVFDQVHDYWQKKNAEDATKFATDARDGFREVAEQASA